MDNSLDTNGLSLNAATSSLLGNIQVGNIKIYANSSNINNICFAQGTKVAEFTIDKLIALASLV